MSSLRRAGQYVMQPSGYRAFMPVPLPPDPPIYYNQELQLLLSEADRCLGRLDGSIETLPHPDWFVFMYVRREAVLSSQIEGTQSSLQDVLAAEAQILAPEGRPRDVEEVVNYVRAMNHGLKRLGELPVSVRLIREIHAELMRGGRRSNLTPGELRTSQNWIGAGGSTLANASFVPPPPHEVAECLSQLERFLHRDNGLPLLVEIGLAHAQFETIHPFLDGNGRVGRLLITFLLCERRALLKPVLYLSYYFKKYRQQYYDLLQAVREHGRWEDWLTFFLRGVIEVSSQAVDTARAVLLLREEHRHAITEKLGGAASNGQRVLEHLYRNPIVSVKDVRTLIGTTNPTANDLVARMVDAGVLSPMGTRARNRRFLYRRYAELFEDERVSAA